MWDNLEDILQKLTAKKPVKSWLPCVARENLRLKNSYIYRKIKLFAPKITKTRKPQHYFSIIVNICAYHGHKNRQKTKTVCFPSIYIRDLNLAPITILSQSLWYFPIAQWSEQCAGIAKAWVRVGG